MTIEKKEAPDNSTSTPDRNESSEYQTPASFQKIKFVKLTNIPKTYRDYFSGHVEFCGYDNKVSGKNRIFAALIQAAIFFLFVSALIYALHWLLTRSTDLVLSAPQTLDHEALISFVALVSTAFGAIYWREVSTYYNRWSYLGNLFNQAIVVDPIKPGLKNQYNKREHLLACLAHDLFIMGMWSHDSFRLTFVDIIEKAVIVDREFRVTEIIVELDRIASHGIDHVEAERIITNYTGYLAPKGDGNEWLFSESRAA